MADYQVAGWSTPKVGARYPEDLPFGTMGRQDAGEVAITGGSIRGTLVAMSPLATGLVSAGVAQGDATLIAAGVSLFATVDAGSGTRLPDGSPGVAAVVVNGGANALLVYPAAGAQIDALGTNAAFSLAAGKGLLLIPVTVTHWVSLAGA